MKLAGLYAITDEVLTPNSTIENQVEEALKNGVNIIQFRHKNISDIDALPICEKLKEKCDAYGALFVLDDRIDLARTLGAALHIGKDDISLIEARKIFDGIIGVSCYGDINRALEAEANGADYVAFGSFFASPTKPNSTVVPLDILKVAKQKLSIPVCVIGGINYQNISQFDEFAPDTISIISGIFNGEISKNCDLLKKNSNLF